MIYQFVEMSEAEQLAAISEMTEDEKTRLKDAFVCLQERKRRENATAIKIELARQFSEDTKERIDRRKGEIS